MTDKPNETPYLHVRPPRRVVGVGGEGDPIAKIYCNRAHLLALRDQVGASLGSFSEGPQSGMLRVWSG